MLARKQIIPALIIGAVVGVSVTSTDPSISFDTQMTKTQVEKSFTKTNGGEEKLEVGKVFVACPHSKEILGGQSTYAYAGGRNIKQNDANIDTTINGLGSYQFNLNDKNWGASITNIEINKVTASIQSFGSSSILICSYNSFPEVRGNLNLAREKNGCKPVNTTSQVGFVCL